MFFVIELKSGSAAVFPFEDRKEAESKYHMILVVASKTTSGKHGALLITDDGFVIKSEIYHNDQVYTQEYDQCDEPSL